MSLISYTVGAGHSRSRTLLKIFNDILIAAPQHLNQYYNGGVETALKCRNIEPSKSLTLQNKSGQQSYSLPIFEVLYTLLLLYFCPPIPIFGLLIFILILIVTIVGPFFKRMSYTFEFESRFAIWTSVKDTYIQLSGCYIHLNRVILNTLC